MKVLALSGSLRAASINSAFCRAAARLAPPPMHVTLFPDMGALPLFNPDLEAKPPRSVMTLRAAVAESRALLIASPEYAHGISGVMKNALDWLVSFEGFVDKPVALANTSPRATHADEALREVLRTMSASIVQEACMAVPLLGAGLTEDGMVSSPVIASTVQAALGALLRRLDGEGDSVPSFPLDGK